MRDIIRAYYYLAKPGIIYGNVLTAAAGFLLAARWHISWGLFVATLLGTSLLIASACIYNNFIDRDIDKKMTRTKKRALVQGTISGSAALFYATFLGVGSLFILILFTNWWVAGAGLIAFVNYVVFYGYTKRHSIYGTIVGSISGAAPITAGYLAVSTRVDSGAVLLFLIMVLWQMPHFYAIAIYRIKDYSAAHIPVLPIKKDIRTTKIQILLYIFGFIIASASLTFLGYTGYTFLVFMTAVGVYWLVKGIRSFRNTDETAWAKRMFLCSLCVLLALAISLPFGAILP